MDEIEIAGYVPGALGRVVELHGSYYDKHWNMGLFFEAKAAREMADFLLNFNLEYDGFWTAIADGQVVGSVSIVGFGGKEAAEQGARLRWFILAEEYQGRGLGKKLLELALEFCRKVGFKRIYLTTFAGLDAARHLYEQQGFQLYEEEEDTHWGKVTIEQKFELWL